MARYRAGEVVVTRINVEAPGQLESEIVELVSGDGVVIGRAPDAATVPGTANMRSCTIGSPSVSANHVAAWIDAERVIVRDLGSRNGTWLRLPQDTSVELLRADLTLRLAGHGGSAALERDLEPPRYHDASDFGVGIAHAVHSWLAERELTVRVWAARGGDVPTGAISMRLASDELLHVLVERTVEERFHDLMARVSRYVIAQNALFSAEASTRDEGMILASPAIRQVHRRVVQAAMENLQRLVLLGPSGTGKERLAQAYHRHLSRTGPLIAINCAALSRDRMVADLFGAEAGAYTGAQRTMLGAVERADGGTLFLDEIGEMPLDVQAVLLRFLDTGEYQRLGAVGVARKANVFVVVATNRDLRRMVAEGAFRTDLFFRLALEVVEVPSLRERFSDAIAYLFSQSLGDTSAHDALQPRALELLRTHAWHGNFRELVNLVQRLPRPSAAGMIDAETVSRALATGAVGGMKPAPASSDLPSEGWLDWLRASAIAFMEDAGGRPPSTWGDVSVFVEQYLKPYALVHMAEVATAASIDDVSVPKTADRIKADRGTITKQLRRYFETRR
jgi:DNA-binding NtrC family response regulator